MANEFEIPSFCAKRCPKISRDHSDNYATTSCPAFVGPRMVEILKSKTSAYDSDGNEYKSPLSPESRELAAEILSNAQIALGQCVTQVKQKRSPIDAYDF